MDWIGLPVKQGNRVCTSKFLVEISWNRPRFPSTHIPILMMCNVLPVLFCAQVLLASDEGKCNFFTPWYFYIGTDWWWPHCSCIPVFCINVFLSVNNLISKTILHEKYPFVYMKHEVVPEGCWNLEAFQAWAKCEHLSMKCMYYIYSFLVKVELIPYWQWSLQFWFFTLTRKLRRK